MVSAAANDLALLHRYASSGDAGAFGELVGRYADMVYATARRVTRDPASAEDVSQDCFLSLAQRSASIRGSVAAWLHRTSFNRALELRRNDQARRAREARAVDEQRDASLGSAGAESLIARVDEALASLPDETRGLLTEHYLCGRTQAELAAAIGVNQSTIARRIEKGLEQLRRCLKDDDRERTRTVAPVLPTFLLGLRDVHAPPALRQAIVKIGLSGVGRGASVGSAGMGAVYKLLATLAAIASIAVASIVLIRANRPAAPATPTTGGADTVVALDQLPDAARKTVEANVPRGSVREVEKKLDLGHTVYDVDFREGDRTFELRVVEDGRLIWKKPS